MQNISSRSNSKIIRYQADYDYFSSIERLTFYRTLMIASMVVCFVALIVFLLQEQDNRVVALMAIFTGLNILQMLLSRRCQMYLKFILGLIYISYIASNSLIGIYGTNVPLFVHGFTSGALSTSIIQFCDIRLKILFVVSTPWVLFSAFGTFTEQNIHFIVYNLCTTILQGFLTYSYEDKLKQIFQQNEVIKQLENIIKQFSTASILAISYDERQRIFKLEFANKLFEQIHSDDIKDFLRNHYIIFDEEQKKKSQLFQKNQTLEEFLFEINQDKNEVEGNSSFSVKIKNKTQEIFYDLQIIRAYLFKEVYFITIKPIKDSAYIEKYEIIILKLKEAIINLSSELGRKLQQFHQSLQKTIGSSKIQGSNKLLLTDIVFLLNLIKNYLIFFQKQKIFSLSLQTENHNLEAFLNILTQLFETKCKLHQIEFISLIQVHDNFEFKQDQKLLSQIFLNIFSQILSYSSEKSIIKFKVVLDENQQIKQQKNTQKSFCSKQEFLNQQDLSQNQILQFTFTFHSDQNIEKLNQKICQSNEEINFSSEQEIESYNNQSLQLNYHQIAEILSSQQIFVLSDFLHLYRPDDFRQLIYEIYFSMNLFIFGFRLKRNWLLSQIISGCLIFGKWIHIFQFIRNNQLFL